MTKSMLRATIIVAVTVLAGSASAAGTAAAQAHARKANSLAAAGKCKQAIPEYNIAYRVLKDPALLFNRAECLRKVGQDKLALYDYRRFLEELPAAPNRKVVLSRIAALDPTTAPVDTRAIVQVPVEEKQPLAAAVPAAPAPAVAPPAPEPSLHTAALRQPLPALDVPPPAPAPEPIATVVVPRPQPAAPESDGRAWLWLSVAAAVVAVAAGGALYLSGKPRNP
jgi:tetratricopeptide (TPR) repeat protein